MCVVFALLQAIWSAPFTLVQPPIVPTKNHKQCVVPSLCYYSLPQTNNHQQCTVHYALSKQTLTNGALWAEASTNNHQQCTVHYALSKQTLTNGALWAEASTNNHQRCTVHYALSKKRSVCAKASNLCAPSSERADSRHCSSWRRDSRRSGWLPPDGAQWWRSDGGRTGRTKRAHGKREESRGE